jgi:hypothetical protein
MEVSVGAAARAELVAASPRRRLAKAVLGRDSIKVFIIFSV